MHIIATVDDRMGMLFNGRRQSRDRVMNERIAVVCGGELWVAPCSAELFDGCDIMLHEEENFLVEANRGAYCFVEAALLLPFADAVDSVTLYKWNRTYPGDFYFDLPVGEAPWHLAESCDFVGSSHDKITEEVYKR